MNKDHAFAIFEKLDNSQGTSHVQMESITSVGADSNYRVAVRPRTNYGGLIECVWMLGMFQIATEINVNINCILEEGKVVFR